MASLDEYFCGRFGNSGFQSRPAPNQPDKGGSRKKNYPTLAVGCTHHSNQAAIHSFVLTHVPQRINSNAWKNLFGRPNFCSWKILRGTSDPNNWRLAYVVLTRGTSAPTFAQFFPEASLYAAIILEFSRKLCGLMSSQALFPSPEINRDDLDATRLTEHNQTNHSSRRHRLPKNGGCNNVPAVSPSLLCDPSNLAICGTCKSSLAGHQQKNAYRWSLLCVCNKKQRNEEDVGTNMRSIVEQAVL